MGHIRRVVAVLAVALLLGAIGVQQRDLILAARTVLPSPSSVESGEASREAPVATNTATLSLNAPADPVTVGETFTVTVTVRDLSAPLAAFQFDLGYDSTILRFVRMEAGGGLRATGRSVVCPNPAPLGPPNPSTLLRASVGGVGVRLACATTGDAPGITAPGDPSAALRQAQDDSSGQALAVLTFVGLADGQSDLTLSAIKLPTDARPPVLIGDVTPQDASVTVGAACTAATLTTAFATAEPAGSVDLAARVSNAAGAQVPAGLPVSFYLGDSQAGGTPSAGLRASLIGTAATTQALGPGASEVVTVTWTGESPGDHTITIVANDDGSGSSPVGLCSAPAPVQQSVSILDVPLVESWNLMSSYVNPFTPDVSVVQRPISGTYTVIQSFDGGALSYYPDLPPEVNTLKEMKAEYGYWVKVKPARELGGTEGTGPGSAGVPPARGELGKPTTLRVVGETFAEDRPLALDAGWNLVSYLPRQPLPVAEALQSIDGQYSAVLGFEQGALSYYPDLDPSFNTLSTMAPLHGYWIKMNQAATLQYPASVEGSMTRGQNLQPAIPGRLRRGSSTFQPSTFPTPIWVNFYGPARLLDGSPLPPGTIVQALDPDGVVCGAAALTTVGQYGLLACYGDDPDTPEDEGARPGDAIRLVVDGQVLGTGTWTAHGERQWVPLGPSELHRLWVPLLRRGEQ